MKTKIKIKHDGNNCKFKKLQEICFKNGIYWRTLGRIYRDTTDIKYGIFIDDKITFTLSEDRFENETAYKEVDIDLFIKTNGTCEEKPTIGIEVGDEYLNSEGKKCKILYANYNSQIKYLYQDGSIYWTSYSNIKKNWTKLTKVQSNTKEFKPIEYYSIELQGTTLEQRLRLKEVLLANNQNVLISSIAFSYTEDSTYNALHVLYFDGIWWTTKSKDYANIDTLIDIETFIELFNPTKEKEEQIPLINDYAIELYDTSLENRLKLRDVLMQRKENVHLNSSTFKGTTTPKINEYFCSINSNKEWMVEGGENCEDKIKVSLQYFLNKFELRKDQTEQTKTIKKGSTIMEKVKQTAKKTVSQNKEAAIIASKMEAGRILNKQVLKQAAKHVPFWAKGYLDSPLAPIIIANAAVMLGNHTGNTKVQKLSELMLLAAADTTVQSFNLDKIIDDALTGIKLPAGILDADDN